MLYLFSNVRREMLMDFLVSLFAMVQKPKKLLLILKNCVAEMAREDSRMNLAEEEANAAEGISRSNEAIAAEESRPDEANAAEGLKIYCKPVAFYDILQRRFEENPFFLQRTLCYMIEAKQNKRILMTVSISDDELQMRNPLPLCVLLGRPISDNVMSEDSANYHIDRACILTTCNNSVVRGQSEANFILPGIKKHSSDDSPGKFTLIFICHGGTSSGGGCLSNSLDLASFQSSVGDHCLCGRLPVKSFYTSLENHGNLSAGHSTDIESSVAMYYCSFEPGSLEEGQSISVSTPHNLATKDLENLQVNISVQEIAAAEYPYTSYSRIPSLSSSTMRLRAGNVIFIYKFHNNTQHRTEVTEDFSCSFCLMKCGSFKGLRLHLCASHDLFHFVFWVTDDYQAVNVYLKTDIGRPEFVADIIDPKQETFIFRSRTHKRRRLTKNDQTGKQANPQVLKPNSLELTRDRLHVGLLEKDACASSYCLPTTTSRVAEPCNLFSLERSEKDVLSNKEEKKMTHGTGLGENNLQNEAYKAESSGPGSLCAADSTDCVASSPHIASLSTVTVQSSAGVDRVQRVQRVQRVSGKKVASQSAKTRKLPGERMDPKRTHLQKQKFFHSQTTQPMTSEQLLSDHDSEGEIDKTITELEDKMKLDDFVDVTKDEKRIMHLWNSLVRKQKVFADGHVPWACEAFSRLHGQELVQDPALRCCWNVSMIKLWNLNLIDGRVMNNCNLIIDGYRTEGSDVKRSQNPEPSQTEGSEVKRSQNLERYLRKDQTGHLASNNNNTNNKKREG